MMLRKFCETTSCNGIIDLYYAKDGKLPFTFWMLVMATMFAASVWFTYRTIVGYMETPTVTNVATLTSSTLDVPDVLICYNGGLNAAAMKAEGLSDNLIIAFHGGFASPRYWIKTDNDSAFHELANYSTRTSYGIKDIVARFSYNCEEVVTYFRTPQISLNDTSKVCSRTTVTPAGNCFAFTDNGKQNFPGKHGGLVLGLKSPITSFSQYYPAELNEFDLDNDFTLTLEKDLGEDQSLRTISVPLNVKTQITIQLKLSKISSKAVPCDDRNYSNTNVCFFNCYLQYNIEECKCMPTQYWYGNNDNNVSACNPLATKCYPDLDKVYACQKNCKPMCSEWLYETSMSYSPIADAKNVSKVRISYNIMQYNEIEVLDAFTTDMAIANVGGQAGLWLGCSIITIIQAIYYIFLACLKNVMKQTHICSENQNGRLDANIRRKKTKF